MMRFAVRCLKSGMRESRFTSREGNFVYNKKQEEVMAT